MKSMCQFLRRNFKYSVCVLAVVLFAVQVTNIVSEEAIEKVAYEAEMKGVEAAVALVKREYVSEIRDKERVSEGEKTDDETTKCKDGPGQLIAAVFKCALAFFLGGMISEMKFIKFGIF